MKNDFLEKLPSEDERIFWKEALEVDPKQGLNDKQVEKARQIYGQNKLVVKKAKSLFARILEHFKELITILLTIAAILSLVLGIIATTHNPIDPIECVALFAEFLIISGIIFCNIFLSIKQANKTNKALSSLKNLVVPTAKVIRNGSLQLIPSVDIVPGDILVLEAGETVIADAKLINSNSLNINESVLTGESFESEKDADFVSDDDTPIADKKNWVFSGTNVTNGSATCQVYYTGMKTQVGKIAQLLDDQKPQLTPLQNQIQKLSKIIGIIAVSVCLLTFIIYMAAMTGFGSYNINGWGESLNVSISLAIASIPETLLAVISIILSISVHRMSKQNALIKQLPAIETLGSLNIVCTDKTGTLTQNVMTVVKTWSTKFPLQTFDDTDSNQDMDIYKYGTLSSDATIYHDDTKTEYIGDPTETAILKGLVKNGFSFEQTKEAQPRFAEIPFDSIRKMMTVVVKSDNPEYPYMVVTKGAPDHIFSALSESSKQHLEQATKINVEMGSNALRVLAVAKKYIHELPVDITNSDVETNLELVGLLGIIDPPRQEAKLAIEDLKRAGIRTIMITGDYKTTATAIAKELKIASNDSEVISGSELDELSDQQLSSNIANYSVYARVTPEHKLRIVNAWKANGQVVAMTGDGVNDAPSLKAADVGCAMGITGTDVAKESASMVLMDDNFATIAKAVDVGRKVLLNIKSALVMLLTANVANFLMVFLGILIFNLSPLKSLQILFINIAVETLLSFAIARNHRKEQVMQLKPRNQKDFIIDKNMAIEIFALGTLISIMSLLIFYIGAVVAHPTFNGDLNKFRDWASQFNTGTIADADKIVFNQAFQFGSMLSFVSIILCLSLSGLYSREAGTIFKQKIVDAKLMLIAFSASVGITLLVAFIPGLNSVFNMDIYLWKTNPEHYAYILLIIASGLVYMGVIELYRYIRGKKYNLDGTRIIVTPSATQN